MMDAVCRIYRIRIDARDFSKREISQIGSEFLVTAVRDFMDSKGEILPSSFPDLMIMRGEYGKPYFPYQPEIEFNISNSGDWIYIAVSGHSVGIDIQKMTGAPLSGIAKRIFLPDEYEAFMKMEDQRPYFFREWVLRESYVKWTGEGIHGKMKGLPQDIWQSHLPAPDGYAAAITAARPLVWTDTEVQYDRQKGFIWMK